VPSPAQSLCRSVLRPAYLSPTPEVGRVARFSETEPNTLRRSPASGSGSANSGPPTRRATRAHGTTSLVCQTRRALDQSRPVRRPGGGAYLLARPAPGV